MKSWTKKNGPGSLIGSFHGAGKGRKGRNFCLLGEQQTENLPTLRVMSIHFVMGSKVDEQYLVLV